jgi:hypothetical protein
MNKILFMWRSSSFYIILKNKFGQLNIKMNFLYKK